MIFRIRSGCRELFGQFSADDQLLDFGGAFIDPQGPYHAVPTNSRALGAFLYQVVGAGAFDPPAGISLTQLRT